MGFLRVIKILYHAGVQEGCDVLEVTVLIEAPLGSRTPNIEMEHRESHLHGYKGGSSPGKADDAATVWKLMPWGSF